MEEQASSHEKSWVTGVSPCPSARQLILWEPLQETEAPGNPQTTVPRAPS